MAVTVHSTIKPKNNRTFPVVEACDVDVNGTPLDTKLENFDGRVGFIEKHLLGIEPEIPDNPDNPALQKLLTPHIALYKDENIIVTIPKLAVPVISFYTDVVEIQQLDTPVITLIQPSHIKLAKPVIELYDEPETPTIIQLATPTIYVDIRNTYSIEPNRRYLLPAVPNGRDTRTFMLNVRMQATDTATGKVYYDEQTYAVDTTNIRNQDYVLEISYMDIDNEGDCYFTYNVDGLFTSKKYANFPQHSTCKIVEAKVVNVGECKEVVYKLDAPVIELYTEVPEKPIIPKLATPSIYMDVA